jgi:dCMP deaminase
MSFLLKNKTMVLKRSNLYLEWAAHFAEQSKDHTTKTGAILVGENGDLLAYDYNHFPDGSNESIESRYEKPQKYLYTEHSERNVIYSCARLGIPTKNAIMYVTYFPCHDCARAIIQSGIKVIVTYNKPDFNHSTWGESWRVANELLLECGIEIDYINNTEL